MTSREAPTIDLEYGFLVVRRLFLAASAWISYSHTQKITDKHKL
jgi:hypothetical protein